MSKEQKNIVITSAVRTAIGTFCGSLKDINRISFGVQEFDIEVQKSIARVQPKKLVERLLTSRIREMFPKGINFVIVDSETGASPDKSTKKVILGRQESISTASFSSRVYCAAIQHKLGVFVIKSVTINLNHAFDSR